jgi:hypothetical protein
MNIFSLRTATWLGATVVAAGLLGTAGCSTSSSTASKASASPKTFTVKQLILGETLKHSFQPNGTGATQTERLVQPDDIAALGGHLYVGFQNNVGSQGEPSASGNLDSTLVELTTSGSIVKQWDLRGKIDGMGADPASGRVFTHYTYTQSPLPHMGGTDAVSVYNGKILVSASAPGTSGTAPKNAAAVYVVTLNATAKTAAVAPFFAINSTATAVNGASAGKTVTLALTDPDSNMVFPSSSPKFAGDFMLNSQGDKQLIFSGPSGTNLQVVNINNAVDDSAVATSASGTLYMTDSSADAVDAMTGPFKPGTMYTAIAPCNSNSAPSTCPNPPAWPPNSLGTINLTTGAVTTTYHGPVTPKGMVFVP